MSGHLGWCKHWLLMAIAAVAMPAAAEELKIEAMLIWATNDDKSPNPKHKPVEPKLAEEFRKIFTWKNYFEVNRTHGVVPNRGTKPFKVSDKCVVEITELEGPKVEVKLIGEGNALNKTTKSLSRGSYFTLGGGDKKNGSAWFVIISQLDEKAAAKPEGSEKVTNAPAK